MIYGSQWFCVDVLSALPINFFLGQEATGYVHKQSTFRVLYRPFPDRSLAIPVAPTECLG